MGKKMAYLLLFLTAMACSGGGDDDPGPQTPDPIVISGTLSGISSSATLNINSDILNTDAGGVFSLEVEDGTYDIIPSKDGFSFNPVARTVVVAGSSQTNTNFTGSSVTSTNAFASSWDFLNPSVVGVSENSASRLNVTMDQNALWFEGSQGGLMYRNVTGNFTFSATVSVRKTSDENASVDCNICLGGLAARSTDNRGGEDYVHIVSGNTPQGLGYETKNTTNSNSPFEPVADGTTDHDLRICREGSTFRLYQKAVGANDWVKVATYNRPDLPPTLQVGFNIYTAQSGAVADLRVIYENAVLTTFSGSPGCQ